MKKSKYSILKLLAVLNLVGMLLLPQTVFAVDENASVSYNSKQKTITVIASVASYEGAAAVVTISKNAENTIMNITRTDSSGMVIHSEVMPESFEGGRYDVTVSTKEKTLTGYIIYPLDTSINAVLPIVNAKETESELEEALKDNADALAIDMLIFEPIAQPVSKVMLKTRPADGWSKADVFLESYNNALAAVNLNSGAAPEKVFSQYGTAFGIDVNEYMALDDSEKLLLDSYLKEADFTLLSVKDTFYIGKAVSQLRAADRWSVMRDKIEENEDILNFDTTYFDKVKNKDVVYQKFYAEFTGKENIDEIRELFLKVSENCYEDENEPRVESSSGGGGGGSSTKRPISVPISPEKPISNTTENKTTEFTDMSKHWAADAVSKLAGKGIISGFEDGTFKPEEKVTRAQFTVMIAKARGLTEGEYCNLSDVEKGSWYEKSVNAAVSAGIVSGMGDGSFRPNEYIRRQDALLILYRAFGEKLQTGAAKSFADKEYISDYAKEAVDALSASGVVTGTDAGELKPIDNTSRAEVAALLARILEIGKE